MILESQKFNEPTVLPNDNRHSRGQGPRKKQSGSAVAAHASQDNQEGIREFWKFCFNKPIIIAPIIQQNQGERNEEMSTTKSALEYGGLKIIIRNASTVAPSQYPNIQDP